MKYWVGVASLPLSRQLVAELARAGMVAPSICKTQPWRIQVSPERQTIEFYTNLDRRLKWSDPGPVVHIACGAAVFNVRVAAGVAGREPIVDLLPDSAAPSLLAAIRVAGHHAARRDERELHAAMTASYERLAPAAGTCVPDAVLAEVVDAARAEGATLRMIEDPEMASAPTLARSLEPAVRTLVNELPQLAVLSTTMGGGTGWLRTGQAMERVLLTARARGIVAIPCVPLPGSAGARQKFGKYTGIDDPLIVLRLGCAHRLPDHPTELLTIGPANAPIVPRPAVSGEAHEGHTSRRT